MMEEKVTVRGQVEREAIDHVRKKVNAGPTPLILDLAWPIRCQKNSAPFPAQKAQKDSSTPNVILSFLTCTQQSFDP